MSCSRQLVRLALVLLSGPVVHAAATRPVLEPTDGLAGWVTTTYGCDPGAAERLEAALHLDDGRVVPVRNAQVPPQTALRVRLSPLAVAQVEEAGSLDVMGTGCDGPFLDCASGQTLGGGSGPLGAQRIVVILVNFRSDPDEHITSKEANDLLVDAGEWYGEVSFDQVWFSAVDVFGYYTVDIDPEASHHDIADAALELADPDIDFTQYDRIVYGWYNSDNFSYGSIGQHPLQTDDGEVIVSEAYMQSFTPNSGGLLRHELGHNFGLGHAVNLSSVDGGTQSYGNTADTMGSGYGRHFGARSKAQLGWLPPGSIIEVTASGAYTIGPLELEHGHPYALKIFKEQLSHPGGPTYDVYYFLEFRQPVGSDASLPFNLTEGPILMSATEGSLGSTTRDCTPETPADYLYDGALLPERTYFDADAGVVIAAGAVQVEYVDVEVRLDPSPTNQPPWHDTIWSYEEALPGGGYFVQLYAGVGDGDSDRLYHFWRFPFLSGVPNPFYSPGLWAPGPRPILILPDATPRRALLTASDSDGASAGWAYFDIAGPVANTAPVVLDTDVVFEPLGELYLFSATVDDAEGDMILYEWDFGDGHSSSLPSPSHAFEGAPPATVELTVSDVQYEDRVLVPIP